MSLTDFGSVSSQIGGGTIGQNSQRNFRNEMEMGSKGLQSAAFLKAEEFRNKTKIEKAKMGVAPTTTGVGGSALGSAASALKGLTGLLGGQGSSGFGGDFASQGAFGIGEAAATGFDTSSIFSSGALDSVSSGAFDIGSVAGSGSFF